MLSHRPDRGDQRWNRRDAGGRKPGKSPAQVPAPAFSCCVNLGQSPSDYMEVGGYTKRPEWWPLEKVCVNQVTVWSNLKACAFNVRRAFKKILNELLTTSSHYSAAAAKSLQSCPTLCDATDSSPPGYSDPRILQARVLEWVAISFSKIITLR